MAKEPSASETGRRGGKSAEAFRTISEVAGEIDIPQHVLRFWESRFNQIKPLKRGGGRRYYRPEDVELLRRIKSLLYDDGYTIKGVQKLFREIGSKTIMESGRSLSGTAGTIGAVGTIGAAGVAAARTRRQSGVEQVQVQQASELPLSAPTSSQPSAMSGNEGGTVLSSGQRDKLLGLAAELGELRDILRRSGAKT